MKANIIQQNFATTARKFYSTFAKGIFAKVMSKIEQKQS
jgi:hypothetical protein